MCINFRPVSTRKRKLPRPAPPPVWFVVQPSRLFVCQDVTHCCCGYSKVLFVFLQRCLSQKGIKSSHNRELYLRRSRSPRGWAKARKPSTAKALCHPGASVVYPHERWRVGYIIGLQTRHTDTGSVRLHLSKPRTALKGFFFHSFLFSYSFQTVFFSPLPGVLKP